VVLHPGVLPANAATTQYGCTFSVPKPTIANRVAAFAVTVKCSNSSYKRQARVELVADDPSYDDTLRATVKTINTAAANYAVAGAGWSCQEDATGADEVYLRVRIESYQSGAWKKAQWVNGSSASGDCR
jgi:hypothetical protein